MYKWRGGEMEDDREEGEGVYRWRGGEVEDGREGEPTFSEAVPAGVVTVEAET